MLLRRTARSECELEREEVVPRRVGRLAILGDRRHQLAERAGEAVDVPGALEVEALDLVALPLELDGVGPEQDAAPNRPLRAVHPEAAARRSRARAADAANEGVRSVRVVDVDPGAPGLPRPVRLAGRAVLERAHAFRR